MVNPKLFSEPIDRTAITNKQESKKHSFSAIDRKPFIKRSRSVSPSISCFSKRGMPATTPVRNVNSTHPQINKLARKEQKIFA